MELILEILAVLALLLVNAGFVAAEFAIVRVRGSRVQELAEAGDPRAATLQRILASLDEYIGVCQVGITVASVALGQVSSALAETILGEGASSPLRQSIALGVSLLVISGSHIVLGEQVPKSIAIRLADRSALWSARPLTWFRWCVLPLLWLLNRCTAAALRLLRQPSTPAQESHTEDELRIILEQSQERGVMSFRRLLFMENVFELGELHVRDVMRSRSLVRTIDLSAPWEEVLHLIREQRFSRFPLIDPQAPGLPVGVVHVKDLLLKGATRTEDHRALARPCLQVQEGATLEAVLADMQRRRQQVALVLDAAGAWTGFLTMEDIIEEIIGTITDEFELDPPIHLADVASPARIVLGIEAQTLAAAIRMALARVPDAELPPDREAVVKAVLDRERLAGTYLGKGVALPHARIPNLLRPVLLLVRSDLGLPVEGTRDRARLLFVLLTPAGAPRIHQRLQARIAGILENSDYVLDRLLAAAEPAEAYEILRTGEQASID